MSTFLFGQTVACTVGHAMPTTFMGHCSLWMWLFVFESSRSLLMAKRGQSLKLTKCPMELIPVVLASSKAS